MRRALRLLLGAGLAMLFAPAVPGCTDASLQALPPPEPPPPDNKLVLGGQVCTKSPEDLVFPLRVLFLVDGSESMEVIDPPDPETGETGREAAVREAATDLLSRSGDVKVSVVRFSSQAQPITAEMTEDGQFESYFTDDLDLVLDRLPILGETDRTTNYIRALSEAYAEIRHELMHSEQESLALSNYYVIMITDGLPDVEGDETLENSSENILEGVEAIMELGRLFHVGNISVNTAFIASGNTAVDSLAEDLLRQMAEDGDGAFRSFASGGELNFMFVDLTELLRVFTVKTLVAQNLNAVVFKDQALPDSDGDSLDDATEAAIGSHVLKPDTDGDGCRDGVEHRFAASGMSPLSTEDCQCLIADYCFDEDEDGLCDCGDDPPGSCCEDEDEDGLCDCIDLDDDGVCDQSNYEDLDGDGLVNCEERYTGTNRGGPDSDADGLVDFLELRFATSPDVNDVADDLDWDSVTNGEEVMTGTDPRHATPEGRSDLAYRYRIDQSAVLEGGRTCFEFEIANVTITELVTIENKEPTVGPGGQGFTGRNRILVFVGEVPFDDLESYARFRVACAEATYVYEGNYRDPPSGRVELVDTDFVDLASFDPVSHCIPPGGRN